MKQKTLLRALSLILCITLLSSLIPSTLATSINDYDTLSTDELWECAHAAETQEEADAIFDAILNRDQQLIDSGVNLLGVTRGYAEQYIKVNSVSLNSAGSSITVNYTVLAIIPSGATINIGCEYPAALRQTAKTFTPTSTKGSYTKTFSAPYYFGARVYGEFRARDYSEKVTYKNFYDDVSSKPSYTFYTITSEDVLSRGFATQIAIKSLLFCLGGIVGGLPAGTAGIVLNWSSDIIDILTLLDPVPALVERQYYRITTYFTGDEMYLGVDIWSSKSSFTSGETPLYSSSRSSSVPHF